jgi:hypothetical protein
LTPFWSVNGNGTRTTSPNLEVVVLGIFRIVPDAAECPFREPRGGPCQAHLVPLQQEVDEVLGLGCPIWRELLDLLGDAGSLGGLPQV